MEDRILKKLEQLRRYVLSRHSSLRGQVDDVLAFAYIEYKTHIDLKTNFKFIVVNYYRNENGGKSQKHRIASLDEIAEDRGDKHMALATEDDYFNENKDKDKVECLIKLINESLKNKPKHRKFMLCLVRGYSKKEISSKMGFSASNGSIIINQSKEIMQSYARGHPEFRFLLGDNTSI